MVKPIQSDMDQFYSSIDSLNFSETDAINISSDEYRIDDEIEEILLNRSNSFATVSTSALRPIDLPSHRKHYGLLRYSNCQLPIIFRLSNNLYVPYIRFSFALTILQKRQSERISPILDMVRNLPILDMTSIEEKYYERLVRAFSSTLNFVAEQSQSSSDWSRKLLSAALLDCLLGILDCSNLIFQNDQFNVDQWQEILEKMRQEVKIRWTIEEKLVLAQIEKESRKSVEEDRSVCISKTSIAQRRLLIEKKIDLRLVERVGGFVQIDAFIFPYIKNSNDMKIYLHINDIRHRYHQHLLLPSRYIRQFSSSSSLAHGYGLVSEQARENYRRNSIHGNAFMSKILPNPKEEEIPLTLLPLDVLLQAKGLCFVQIFDKASLDFILLNYQNQIARQFILDSTMRHGGLINDEIPLLTTGKPNIISHTWIPTETKSSRLMTQDERLFINSFLLYHGLTKLLFPKERRWYLQEIDADILSSKLDLFDKEYYERKQRKIFSNC